jgi:LacI family transcriptional regulator
VACLWRRGELYARRRRAAFRQLARRAGVACDDATTDDLGGDAEAWRDWLKALPEGAGLLASSDDVARRCLLALDGVRSIPGSLSVLGVGNSRRMCDTVRPGLSSVIVPWRQIGYRAAEVLDEVRRKRDVSGGLVAVPPAGIAWRQSTGAESVDDPLVRRALAWMTEHAPSGGNVSDLLRTLNVSRRTLETRFRAALQRTPLEQLHLARIEIAKRMLSVADDKIEAIARKSGFHGRDRFGKVFRRLVGLTPAQYREQAREDTVD